MKPFSINQCISHSNSDAINFVDHLITTGEVLFIGAVGLDHASLYFAQRFGTSSNVDFRFIVEKRASETRDLLAVGATHTSYLEAAVTGNCEFHTVEVIATDGATTGGRNVTNIADPWMTNAYTDVVIDVTGMSRGVFFPLVKFAYETGLKKNLNIHVVASSNETLSIQLSSEANDRADWMHGFQGNAEADSYNDYLKLWVPQLSPGAINQASLMYSRIQPTVAEICPIVPFPSREPRQGDKLLQEYAELLYNRWGSSLLNIMYAHESDPIDAYRSIHRMHETRELIFNNASGDRRALTILSPAGWRIGTLGMLLAALELDLPVLYVETVGYNVEGEIPSEVVASQPDSLWHIWLVGEVYEDEASIAETHSLV